MARRPSCRRAISSLPPIGRRTITAIPPKKPMLWLDVLDFPAVNFYETSFAEHSTTPTQTTTRAGRRFAELLRLGRAARRQLGQELHAGHQLHLCAHPADRRAHAERRATSTSVTARACTTRIRSPAARFCRRWALGSRCSQKGLRESRTALPTAQFSFASKGQGSTNVDGSVLEWGPNDVFVVPPWKRYSHNVAKETVLFSISDRPAQKALGIWREGK